MGARGREARRRGGGGTEGRADTVTATGHGDPAAGRNPRLAIPE